MFDNLSKLRMKIFIIVTLLMITIFATSCSDNDKETFKENDENGKIEAIDLSNEVAKDGTMLFGKDISGKSFQDIKENIDEVNKKLSESHFSIIAKDTSYTVNYSDIKYVISKDDTIKNIKDGKKDSISYTYDEKSLSDLIASIIDTENIDAKNATIQKSGGGFDIKDGENGLKVNEEKLTEDMKPILDLEKFEIKLEYSETSPKYTREVYNDFTLIGTYSTKYKTQDTSRNINLAQASNKINNSLLFPDEVFSTNDHYGKTTVENGYAVANVIVGNELVEGLGGGVCQISSTLYNAVLRSELLVVERRNHSLPVSYVPLGFDATLANPYIDFKFKNSQDTPVLICAYIDNGIARVDIYGKEIHSSTRELKFTSETVSVKEAGLIEENDNTLATGEKVQKVSALNGQTVNTYKHVYENGVLLETVSLSKSVYVPRDAVVKVGTNDALVKAKPPSTPTPTKVPATPAPIAVPTETPFVPAPTPTPPELIPTQAPTEIPTETQIGEHTETPIIQ